MNNIELSDFIHDIKNSLNPISFVIQTFKADHIGDKELLDMAEHAMTLIKERCENIKVDSDYGK